MRVLYNRQVLTFPGTDEGMPPHSMHMVFWRAHVLMQCHMLACEAMTNDGLSSVRHSCKLLALQTTYTTAANDLMWNVVL